MKRTPLPPRRKEIKRSAIKKRPRKPSETLRIYGPPARRRWIKAMPCAACGIEGFTEQAHCPPTIEAGGTGYKADSRWIAPLCGPRPVHGSDRLPFYIGCHRLYDNHHERFTARFPNLDMQAVAREVEKLWQRQQQEN